MSLKTKNYYPEKIVTNLEDYRGLNLFEEYFYINTDKLQEWKNYDMEKVLISLKRCCVSHYGIGNSKGELDIEILNLVFNTYFNFTEKVINEEKRIKEKYNIPEEYNFILWRKTDKLYEIVDYPELSEGLAIFDNMKNLVAQTDDLKVFLTLKENNEIKVLEELPLSSTNEGVHYLCKRMSNEQHKEHFNHDYKDHGLKLLAILLLASKSKTMVGYPGNLTFIIAVLRKSFDSLTFFKQRNLFF